MKLLFALFVVAVAVRAQGADSLVLSSSFDDVDVPSLDDVEYSSSSSLGHVQIIVRAFIPSTLSGALAVPGQANKKMFKGPLGMCWGTDNRGFSNSASPSSRVYMKAEFNMDAKRCTLLSKGTSGTHRYDCDTGAVKCHKRSSVSANCEHSWWYTKVSDGKYTAKFEVAGSNPCAPGPAPDADADGRIEVYPGSKRICLKMKIDRFPSYEVLFRRGTSGSWKSLARRSADRGVAFGLITRSNINTCKTW